MDKREKVTELFKELINYQLKEHGVTFDDVKSNPQWYMNYKTTPEKQDMFIEHIVERCKKVLKMNNEQAKNEAQWFILQWGLTIDSSEYKKSEESITKNKINNE